MRSQTKHAISIPYWYGIFGLTSGLLKSIQSG